MSREAWGSCASQAEARAVCRQREEATDLCGTGCPHRRQRALRDKAAPSGSKSSVLARGRRSAPALRLGGGRGGGDGGGGARQGGASASGRVGRLSKEGRAPVGMARKGVFQRGVGGLGGTLVCLAHCMPQVTYVYPSLKPFPSPVRLSVT